MTSGTRAGRYLLLRDADGQRHAVALSAALALCELDSGGTVLLLPGGRLLRLDEPLEQVLAWLSP
ncbi:hypothetical protein [Teichococcus vastitatis]|jgi:hypothetical protein|uniref:Uncharacterized protein n=1 Tax=Teichococcus vastitatis TaxID=2307076 RepID=A0ABS9W8P8_9PROT|nr:hypothetical protein [Pseudoroseomonas vastitatis]MCI0755658.1 hypothetical protein [Pseudoroseomonas vastitatis]